MSWLLNFVKKKEGFRERAYQDAVGVWTIGYGSTKGVKPGDTITEPEAAARLNEELAVFRDHVNDYNTRYNYNWTEGQIDALTSFAYNIGSIKQLTGNGKRDNATIAKKIKLYNKANGRVLSGLTARRIEEAAKFVGDLEGSSTSNFRSSNSGLIDMPTTPTARMDTPQTDGMSFGDAFRQARASQGAGGEFTWKGNRYNTNYAADGGEVEEQSWYDYGSGLVSDAYDTVTSYLPELPESFTREGLKSIARSVLLWATEEDQELVKELQAALGETGEDAFNDRQLAALLLQYIPADSSWASTREWLYYFLNQTAPDWGPTTIYGDQGQPINRLFNRGGPVLNMADGGCVSSPVINMADGGEVSAEAIGWTTEGKKYAEDNKDWDKSIVDALDFVPIIGDVKAYYEAGAAWVNGNKLEAGLLAGAATIGLVPGVGDAFAIVIKKAAKVVGRVFASIAKGFADEVGEEVAEAMSRELSDRAGKAAIEVVKDPSKQQEIIARHIQELTEDARARGYTVDFEPHPKYQIYAHDFVNKTINIPGGPWSVEDYLTALEEFNHSLGGIYSKTDEIGTYLSRELGAEASAKLKAIDDAIERGVEIKQSDLKKISEQARNYVGVMLSRRSAKNWNFYIKNLPTDDRFWRLAGLSKPDTQRLLNKDEAYIQRWFSVDFRKYDDVVFKDALDGIKPIKNLKDGGIV